jgi:hypothetical protein
MKVLSLFRKVFYYPEKLSLFCLYRMRQEKKPAPEKYIYLEVGNNVYKRYLYTLLKFFSLQGYSVYMRGNADIFYSIMSENYAHYLLKEGILRFGKLRNVSIYKTNADWEGILSPDYFNDNGIREKNSFHFPMTQHPLMYHAGWWNEEIPLIKRKMSVFMAGNLDANVYTQTSLGGAFNICSRFTVYEFLKNSQQLFEMERIQDLYEYLEGEYDQDIVLVNRLKFDVPMDKLRNLLSRFSFFLALPGMIMPFSHNIIEAMSCGCIPLIEEKYASMFSPPLKHQTHVILFSGLEDLAEKISLIFHMDDGSVESMRRNVQEYYEEHLTPHKVIAKIEKSKPAKIYLQAEDYSVGLLKNELSYKYVEHFIRIHYGGN